MTCNMIFDCRKMEVVSGITKKAELPLENVNDTSQMSKERRVFQMFKDLYISRKQPEEEERTIFFEDCRQLLENGYKFKFIIISSYINDLIQLDAFSKNSVEKAKKAFQFLLPYGLNLCRYPEQREYRLIKTYTAYFCCRIKDNLAPLPEFAETVLQGMGYKHAASPDEMILQKVSNTLLEVCFDIIMCQVEFDRLMSILDFASDQFGMSDIATIQLWEQFFHSNRCVWSEKDFQQYLQKHVKKQIQRLPDKALKDTAMAYRVRQPSPVRNTSPVIYSSPERCTPILYSKPKHSTEMKIEQVPTTMIDANVDDNWMSKTAANNDIQAENSNPNWMYATDGIDDRNQDQKYGHQKTKEDRAKKQKTSSRTSSHIQKGKVQSCEGSLNLAASELREPGDKLGADFTYSKIQDSHTNLENDYVVYRPPAGDPVSSLKNDDGIKDVLSIDERLHIQTVVDYSIPAKIIKCKNSYEESREPPEGAEIYDSQRFATSGKSYRSIDKGIAQYNIFGGEIYECLWDTPSSSDPGPKRNYESVRTSHEGSETVQQSYGTGQRGQSNLPDRFLHGTGSKLEQENYSAANYTQKSTRERYYNVQKTDKANAIVASQCPYPVMMPSEGRVRSMEEFDPKKHTPTIYAMHDDSSDVAGQDRDEPMH